MITPRVKRRVKRQLTAQPPSVWIGKNGVSKQVIAEIEDQLERVEMVKGRILRGALEERNTKTLAGEIAQQTESALVEVRGHTFILFRKKRKGRDS